MLSKLVESIGGGQGNSDMRDGMARHRLLLLLLLLPAASFLLQPTLSFSIKGTSPGVRCPLAASKLLSMLKHSKKPMTGRAGRPARLNFCPWSMSSVENQAERYLQEMNQCRILGDRSKTATIFWVEGGMPTNYMYERSDPC